VIVARPPYDEIEAVFFYLHNDLFDQHANDSFARGDRGSFGMPCALDIGAELQQGLWSRRPAGPQPRPSWKL
jgi:hypothetical protein